MPIYDYTCNKCGKVFEALVLPRRPGAKCPKCDSADLKQMISRQFAVDSEGTRTSNAKGQKKKVAGIRKDYEVAQREYEEHHRH